MPFLRSFVCATLYFITRHLVVSFKLISFLDLPLGKRIRRGKKNKTELCALSVPLVGSQRQVKRRGVKRCSSDCVGLLPKYN